MGLRLLASQCAEEIPPDSPWKARIERLAELAGEAERQIDQIVRGLILAPASPRGLRAALRALARSFESHGGITVLERLPQVPDSQGTEAAGALFRVAHKALASALHSRCSTVRLDLSFDHKEAVLRVADDGVGLGRRWQEREGRLGMAAMRRAAESAGGTFRASGTTPHGVEIEARVPLPGRR